MEEEEKEEARVLCSGYAAKIKALEEENEKQKGAIVASAIAASTVTDEVTRLKKLLEEKDQLGEANNIPKDFEWQLEALREENRDKEEALAAALAEAAEANKLKENLELKQNELEEAKRVCQEYELQLQQMNEGQLNEPDTAQALNEELERRNQELIRASSGSFVDVSLSERTVGRAAGDIGSDFKATADIETESVPDTTANDASTEA